MEFRPNCDSTLTKKLSESIARFEKEFRVHTAI
jgi:hypothetical protein